MSAAGGRLSEPRLRHVELVLDIPRVRRVRRNDEVTYRVLLPLLFVFIRYHGHRVWASCIFIPDSVGVGSSGALMGMLSSWIVWIVFRW